MGENKSKKPEAQSGNMEQVLRERERLDQLIEQKFRKKRAVVFSDVCGFTQYVEKMGDIRGRAWIQKHHDIVLPRIEEHDGKVIDIIGDGVMASFPDALSASKASIAIQKCLYDYNAKANLSDRIHVKIGINSGEILMDNEHIAGDVVNVASRIQSQAGPDQILISKNVYEEICESDDILCRFHKKAKVKGKAEPLELYRIIWKEEDIVLRAEPRVRALDEHEKKKMSQPQSMLHVEIARIEDHLKISASEQIAGETSTVRQYEDIPVPMDQISARCRTIVETLNKANRQGRVTLDILMKLREIGQVLSDDLFTPNVKDHIRETRVEHLVFNIDDQLVQVPWELLHDGRQFLCQKFSMGRLVRTKQSFIGNGKVRALDKPLKMLILADPKGDLKDAYLEGTQIRDFIDNQKGLIHASLQTDNVTSEYLRERIRNFDLVHFAGHYDYDPQNLEQSGWRLTGGGFSAQDILKMAGIGSMPALIFSNACQSARTEEWSISQDVQTEIFGLANAFILAGVKHYVGTFWEVLDEPSRKFALEFYKNMLKGLCIGEAVRQARLSVIEEYGEETIVWASYLLYGDPVFNYMDQLKTLGIQETLKEPSYVQLPETEVRAREEVIDFAGEEARKKPRAWFSAVAGMIIVLAIVLFGYPGLLRQDTEKYEKAVLAEYSAGKYEEALASAKILEDKDSKVRLSHLIQGDIYFRKGNFNESQAAYEKALVAPKGTDLQKAKALVGLGRIASLRKQTDQALNYYQQSTETAPDSELGYLSQALLLDSLGNSQQALGLLSQARQLAPQNRLVAAIAEETRKKVSFKKDQEKQNRINQLVQELLEGMKNKEISAPSDGWTSQALTLWIMDFNTQGYSLQEGEDRLIAIGISDQVLQHSRARLVERSLLEKLLEELKLGTSKLTDRSTALSLGKIMAARLILSGRIIYSEPQTQVAMRLIETETGRITAAVTETTGSAVPITVLTDKLSEKLVRKLNEIYPLRGKVMDQSGQEVKINLGENVGIKIGQHFKVVDEDVMLEIFEVQQDTSLAKFFKGQKTLEEGGRVELFISNN